MRMQDDRVIIDRTRATVPNGPLPNGPLPDGRLPDGPLRTPTCATAWPN